ncbi:MAG: hypothetical protein KDI37_11590, partial [Xanthomonadales bacterium]|nr:hypothetical protein [Xanthomonadales bacterium]
MRHVAAIADLGSAGVREVLALAARAKGGERIADLAGRTLGLLFADPSLRTRASMDQAAHRLGG